MALEEYLRTVREYWNSFEFDLATYQNRCRLIKGFFFSFFIKLFQILQYMKLGWEELFSKLDEHLNAIISMKNSPYYKVFMETSTAWEEKLTKGFVFMLIIYIINIIIINIYYFSYLYL